MKLPKHLVSAALLAAFGAALTLACTTLGIQIQHHPIIFLLILIPNVTLFFLGLNYLEDK